MADISVRLPSMRPGRGGGVGEGKGDPGFRFCGKERVG